MIAYIHVRLAGIIGGIIIDACVYVVPILFANI